MSLINDVTPRGLLLTGLVLASAITTANAVSGIFTNDTTGAKIGKAGVAALLIGGTSLAAGTILKQDDEPVAARGKYYK
jgi:hypothetical protein